MDTYHTLRLAAILTVEFRVGGYRRDRIKRTWDGYCSEVLATTGSEQKAWDYIRRRERMAEACYEV